MSDTVLAIPLARLFAQPSPAAGPSEADRRRAELDEAFEAGRAAGEARLQPRISALEAERDALQAAHAAALEADGKRAVAMTAALEAAFADALAALGHAVAGAVLSAEPRIGAATLRQLVADALSGLPDGAAGTLRMSPADAAQAPALPSGWALLADDSLAPGQVVAECGSGLSAAGLSHRLRQACAALEAGE